MSEILGVMQQIMQNTMEGMKLADVATGTMVSVAPPSIRIDISMQTIPAGAIILTDAVKPRTAAVQDGAGGTVVISEGLAAGDKVLMLRVSNGQRYIVLSKL